MDARKEQDLETRSKLVKENRNEIENISSKQTAANNGPISGQSFDPESIEPQNFSKRSDMVFRENLKDVLQENTTALNLVSDNFPRPGIYECLYKKLTRMLSFNPNRLLKIYIIS